MIETNREGDEKIITDSIFLTNSTAKRLYRTTADTLPIADYHCHLSPREIYEDIVFENIAKLWLSQDHYKWRLMRNAGIEECFITGDADDYLKFRNYAQALSRSPGNPLHHWSHLELKRYFEINKWLSPDTADDIWEEANAVIREKRLSPRKLIALSRVEHLATTDDIADSLEYHQLLQEDQTFQTVIAPTFRIDSLLLIQKTGYGEYIKKLSDATELKIYDISSLEAAVVKRLDYFCSLGCTLTDVGIEQFPSAYAGKEEADAVFRKALSESTISPKENEGFIGYWYLVLAKEYKKRNMTMQLHTGVKRNVNKYLFDRAGADSGGDVSGNPMDADALCELLNKMQGNDGLPNTILYALNPTSYYPMFTAAGSFSGVSVGAAWWHCDHKDGVLELLKLTAALGSLGSFSGMLTDSRSFLSYARHNYFRRILCSLLGEWIEHGEMAEDENTKKLIEDICYYNSKKLFEVRR